ncbi:MAG: hypothetical protein M0Z81_07625 [Deltaproteobacteria bacterium]|jgi:hypothetical protein|nr:hypothetical protein [Deltaproteobacteria bacterium]
MKLKEAIEDKGKRAPSREPYEPPRADFAPVSLQERLMDCGETSYNVCGNQAAYH